MYCQNCHEKLEENYRFCPNCRQEVVQTLIIEKPIKLGVFDYVVAVIGILTLISTFIPFIPDIIYGGLVLGAIAIFGSLMLIRLKGKNIVSTYVIVLSATSVLMNLCWLLFIDILF